MEGASDGSRKQVGCYRFCHRDPAHGPRLVIGQPWDGVVVVAAGVLRLVAGVLMGVLGG